MLKELFGVFKEGDLYAQAMEDCHEMLDITRQMFRASVESLRRRDSAEIDLDVYATDQVINRFERDVRRKVMTHLAISGKAELTSGLVLVSIVIDIERIGDYAKNIYDLAVHHPARLQAGSREEQVTEIEGAVDEMLDQAIESFKESDPDLARKLMTDYKKQISRRCDEITFQFVQGVSTDLSAADQVTVALYLRFLKRIAAHSRNMATSVVNPFDRIGYPE
ncbi:MAG: PhoU domain-containing protein [bacterium]